MEGLKQLLKIERWTEAITWIIIIIAVIFIRFTPSNNVDNDRLLYFAGLVLIFALFYYYVLYKILPFTKRQWIKNVGDVILIGILIRLAGSFSMNLITLFFMPIAASMFLLGSINSLLIAVLAVVVVGFEITADQNILSSSTDNPYSSVWTLLSILAVVIYTRFLAHQVHHEKNLKEEAKRNLTAAQNKLTEFENLEREFVSLTAHQLFTPLSVIRGFLSMMIQGDTGKLNTKQKQYTEETYKYTLRMIHLVKELLNISRIEGGHYKISPKTLDIEEMLAQIVKELKISAEKQGVALILNTPEGDIPSVLADKDHTPEIFLNLVHNGIKYSPKGGDINISLQVIHRKNKQFVKVDVADQGIGIPEDEHKYVFQRFFRAANILSIDNSGTGLGLFIAKKLVEEQGGEISFTSKEGKGTTFSVLLPTAAA